jgi:hypothetical protein
MNMERCQDGGGCDQPALYSYVWTDGTKYLGCTRHAYGAAAAFQNMGRTLELMPLRGGKPEVIGAPVGRAMSPDAPPPGNFGGGPGGSVSAEEVRDMFESAGALLGRFSNVVTRLEEALAALEAKLVDEPAKGGKKPEQKQPEQHGKGGGGQLGGSGT